MGILNITPDSFYDGKRFIEDDDIARQVTKMIDEGVDIIDVGGYSSRPGAEDISEKEELNRLNLGINIVRSLSSDIPISVDTFRSKVAETAIENLGADIINDISGGELDPDMFDTVASLGVPYILMHMKGRPQDMQSFAAYDDLLLEMTGYFEKKLYILREKGVSDVIVDPGFGFAKGVSHNFELLKKLDLLGVLEAPLLVGVSRKSTIYKTLGTTAEDALNGTTALNMVALMVGANILRVHDVKEAKETIKLYKAIYS